MKKLFQQYFDGAAKKNYAEIACIFNNEKITYGALNDCANQLARFLKKNGVKRGDRVCFCLHKSISSIQVILAILKADAVYVPLDAFSPAERLHKIIDDALPVVVICSRDTVELVKKSVTKNTRIVCLEDKKTATAIVKESKEIPAYRNTADNLAYILYTSGSTGIPKGVMIMHRNLIGCAEWAVRELGIKSSDVLSSHPPFHFDLSMLDICACFKAGASLVIVPEKLSVFPGALLAYIEKCGITVWNSVPSLLSYLAKSGILKKNRIPTVKKVFFNGEVFPAKYLAQWMTIFPNKEFINMYGPTEATVQCCFYRVKHPPQDFTRPVPIGRACKGAKIFAMTERGTRAKYGERGEIYIGGRGVGKGYWRNPAKTKASFVQNPFSKKKDIVYKTGDLALLNKQGDYEFLGRIDHQVKHLGYRIELGEVEAAFYAIPYVKEVAVIAYTERDQTVIAAFVVLDTAGNRRWLLTNMQKIVPVYMVPQRLWVLPRLPRTSTGKVDRAALKNNYAKEV